MPQQPNASLMNSFIGGLKTEFTGLNFPENACTDTENFVFTLIGDVQRRLGFDFENNFENLGVDRTNLAISSYRWNNVAGLGNTQIYVLQVGSNLFFYRTSDTASKGSVSATLLPTELNISFFLPAGSPNAALVPTTECQFTDGNGYLFVFHPYLEPSYYTYDPNTGNISSAVINIQVRDFQGIVENGVPVNNRPTVLSADHQYNLQNQGWTQGIGWAGTSTTSVTIGTGSKTFTIQGGLTIPTNNPQVSISFTFNGVTTFAMQGNVTSYNSGTGALVVSVSSSTGSGTFSAWTITPANTGFINTFVTAIGAYPSNSDVWWRFKNTSDVFDPANTVPVVTAGTGAAPSGFYVLNAFKQDRATASGLSIPTLVTYARPKTGVWFEGRVWYAGVDGSGSANPEFPFYSWSENIYFSQVVSNTQDFGSCYEVNDPTSEDLFAILPTDGGVITIQGCGVIYKLFPLNQGLLVFAANGVWLITGSQSLGGFAANDYTIQRISSVQSMSGTSFVNVNGFPMFWNTEGIYLVEPGQGNQPYRSGGLTINPVTLGTILSYYNNIPEISKKYVRGDYNPITYVVQWCFRSTPESDITSRYEFDTILNLNVANRAFYPYTFAASLASPTHSPWVHDVKYFTYPEAADSPDPDFKYISSFFTTQYGFTFSEEIDTTHTDWKSLDNLGRDYSSFFIAGYSLKGQAVTKWQVPYLHMYFRNANEAAYVINGLWDYSISGNSGRFSVRETVDQSASNVFNMGFRRHRIRGRGMAFQLKVTSLTGKPCDLMGWSMFNAVNQRP